MPIKLKGPGNGDLKNPSKKEQKARLAKFSADDNKKVALSIRQQSNGFKGESKNDHGLPDGHVSKDIDREETTGPKARKQGNLGLDKYKSGTKGIKMKKSC